MPVLRGGEDSSSPRRVAGGSSNARAARIAAGLSTRAKSTQRNAEGTGSKFKAVKPVKNMDNLKDNGGTAGAKQYAAAKKANKKDKGHDFSFHPNSANWWGDVAHAAPGAMGDAARFGGGMVVDGAVGAINIPADLAKSQWSHMGDLDAGMDFRNNGDALISHEPLDRDAIFNKYDRDLGRHSFDASLFMGGGGGARAVGSKLGLGRASSHADEIVEAMQIGKGAYRMPPAPASAWDHHPEGAGNAAYNMAQAMTRPNPPIIPAQPFRNVTDEYDDVAEVFGRSRGGWAG